MITFSNSPICYSFVVSKVKVDISELSAAPGQELMIPLMNFTCHSGALRTPPAPLLLPSSFPSISFTYFTPPYFPPFTSPLSSLLSPLRSSSFFPPSTVLSSFDLSF